MLLCLSTCKTSIFCLLFRHCFVFLHKKLYGFVDFFKCFSLYLVIVSILHLCALTGFLMLFPRLYKPFSTLATILKKVLGTENLGPKIRKYLTMSGMFTLIRFCIHLLFRLAYMSSEFLVRLFSFLYVLILI